MAYPNKFLWVSMCTTGLPEGTDFSQVLPLEISVMLTDFDLSPITQYTALVKPTKEHVAALKEPRNYKALQVAKRNGVLKEASHSTDSLASIDAELVELLREHENLEYRKIMLAGSGVSSYDILVIKEHLPNLSRALEFFTLDTGVLRRAAMIFTDKNIRQIVDFNARPEDKVAQLVAEAAVLKRILEVGTEDLPVRVHK